MKNVIWLITLIIAVIFGSSLTGITNYGDLATWVAAVGTVCTLAFLVKQHIHNEDRSKFERNMWITEIENSHFSKFEACLEDIIEAENYELKFQYKRKLHRAIGIYTN